MLNAQRSLLTKLSITDLIIQCIAAAATAGAGAAVHADCATANCAAFALVTTHSLSFKQSDCEGWRGELTYRERLGATLVLTRASCSLAVVPVSDQVVSRCHHRTLLPRFPR